MTTIRRETLEQRIREATPGDCILWADERTGDQPTEDWADDLLWKQTGLRLVEDEGDGSLVATGDEIEDEDFEALAVEAAAAGDEVQWAMALGAAGRSPASHGGTLPERANEILLERQWDVLQDLGQLRREVARTIRHARAQS